MGALGSRVSKDNRGATLGPALHQEKSKMVEMLLFYHRDDHALLVTLTYAKEHIETMTTGWTDTCTSKVLIVHSKFILIAE